MLESRYAYVMESDNDTRKLNFNLTCAVHANEQITATEKPRAFQKQVYIRLKRISRSASTEP